MSYDRRVRKCTKCDKWINFDDRIVCVEFGLMGQDHWDGSGFLCHSRLTEYYHESCYKS